jgi:hypothetical protein
MDYAACVVPHDGVIVRVIIQEKCYIRLGTQYQVIRHLKTLADLVLAALPSVAQLIYGHQEHENHET